MLDLSDTGIEIQPTMYGIFFEDINFAADGGVYSELVKNRSFEFDNPLMGWFQPNTKVLSQNSNSGFATVINREEESNNHYCRITVNNDSAYSIINEGFRGMGVKAGALYNLSILVANPQGNVSKIRFQFVDNSGIVLGETSIANFKKDWTKHTAQIRANDSTLKGNLKISFEGNGNIDLDMISIFPEDTWKKRPGGLRKDLVQKLADLNPGFLRFPGGCIVEGRILSQRYQWKKSVGSVENRETIVNRWNTEFDHRPTPDYFQSYGLGFFEYFQLAEDLNAEPLPIVNCGMACQFNTGELVPMANLDPYVQDALDLIEFANGDEHTTWGKLRSELGHPQPFKLKYIGVGNEQWGSDYIERYQVFEKAIRERYPNIIIIAGSGPLSEGEYFDYGWDEMKKLNAQIVDEHFYLKANWFLQNADRYDQYDRNGPKVFAGEYAAQSEYTCSLENKNNWGCALAEAAFMTGLERNAEVVHLTSYAPVMAHVDAWQWKPDLIWFNNLESFATPNYYVQQLFAQNSGTHLVQISHNRKPLIGQNGLYATAVIDKNTNEVIIKVVNASPTDQHTKFSIKGGKLALKARLTTLKGDGLNDENTFNDELVSPIETEFFVNKGHIKIDVPAYAFILIKTQIK